MANTQSGQIQFFQKSYSAYDYVFTFGKYLGAKYGDVLAIDPAYIQYCIKNAGTGGIPANIATIFATATSGYGLLANQGQTVDPKMNERSWICTICNQAFPEHLIRKFRGKYYCIPNGDYKDIASILKTERARRYKPDGIGTERVIPPIIRG